MRQALTFLYSRIVIESIVILGVIALTAGRLRRRLRISPEQATRAPTLWLVNLTADARLHRRLRHLAARARRAARGGARHHRRPGRTSAQRLAVDLEAELIVLDERLVESRPLDFDGQRAVVRSVRADAHRIADCIDRVGAVIDRESNDPAATVAADPIGELEARITQLEAVAAGDADKVIDASARDGSDPAIRQARQALDSTP